MTAGYDCLNTLRKQGLEEVDSTRFRITVGMGICGQAADARELLSALKQSLAESNEPAIVDEVGCKGLCYAEPLVEVRYHWK